MPDIQKLLTAIDWAEENSYGSDTDGQLEADRAYSINLYLGENVDPAPTGRSQVTDRSVFETIQWIMPSLCRIFANGSDLVSIPPIGPDDEEAAKQEAEYTNWVITESNPWFQIFDTWATSALMTRNSYVLAYVDKKRQVDVEVYERQTEEGVALIMQDEKAEILDAKQYPDPDGQPQQMIDPVSGQPVMLPPPMLFDLKVRRTDESRKLCLRAIPPERVKVSQYTPSFRLAEDCDYFEFWDYQTISSLRAEGFKVPDDIANGELVETQEDSARDIYDEQREDNKNDPSMRRIKTRRIWIRHDYDGDGIAELRYVVRLGRVKEDEKMILVNEEATSIPAACIVPSALPFRHMGMSITDMVADIQRIKTTILRGGLDNMYLSNNPQKVLDPNYVNLDDALSSIPGGVIRTTNVDAIRYEKHPFIFPEAMEGLEYMDQIRENRTGTSRYFTGIDQNALNKTATGVQQLSTMAAQRVEQIARVLGAGIEDLARVVHELILRMGHKKEVVRIRGRWIEVDPSTWKKRTDFKLAVGTAAGNKDAMVARLTMIAQAQLKAAEMGIPIVTPDNMYAVMVELTKASDFSSPERFWTEPSKVPQQQAPSPEQIKAEADQMRLQGEMAAKEAELTLAQEQAQAELALKEKEIEGKLALEKYKVDVDSQVKLETSRMQGENAVNVEKERAVTQSQKQDRMKVENLDKLDKVAESSEKIVEAAAEQSKMLADTVIQITEKLAEAVEALGRPKKIIRDAKTGRATGVESA